jgi:hypothetical protein
VLMRDATSQTLYDLCILIHTIQKILYVVLLEWYF